MSLGGLVDKILVYRSCSHRFDPSYGASFFFLTTPIHICVFGVQRVKKRHNIRQLVVSGEAGDVSNDTVTAWKERLVTLVRGYAAKDIWNLHVYETQWPFFRALPEKSLPDAKECRGGKRSKLRLTVALFVNSAGEKELSIVIGKSKSPRCFKGLPDKAKPHGIPIPRHG